ncbi:MAG: 60S ribosomal export protein NMD3 [Candidatus Diapherotrites archaeon]|nr:60S ribosomal export protein NMD3 [Candidatus Diapherotrites archaeon]
MKEFCPKCGKDSGTFIQGFCSDCFIQDHELVSLPEVIELEYCSRCNHIKAGHKWVELTDDKLREIIASKLKSKEAVIEWSRINFLEELTEGKRIAVVTIKGKINDSELEFDKKTSIELKKTICDSCMKSVSNYYECTLQIRFDENPSNKQRRAVMDELNEFLDARLAKDALSKITGMQDDKKGFDVLIGSKTAGKESALYLAKKFNSKVISSDSLVGLKSNGKPKKRLTFCIRPKV